MSTHFDSPLHMMEVLGGSFVRSLAACYYAADPANKAALRVTFADYFATYELRFSAWKADSATESLQATGEQP